MVLQAGVNFHFLPLLHHDIEIQLSRHQHQQQFQYLEHCASPIPTDCLRHQSLLAAGSMDCLALRNCDVTVDVVWFEALFQQLSVALLAFKYRNYHNKMIRLY